MNPFYPLPQVYQKNVPPGEGAKIWIVQLWTYIFSMVILLAPCYIVDILIVCCASKSAAGRGGERANACRETGRAVLQPSLLEQQWGCAVTSSDQPALPADGCREPCNRSNLQDHTFFTKHVVHSHTRQAMLCAVGRGLLCSCSPSPVSKVHLFPLLISPPFHLPKHIFIFLAVLQTWGGSQREMARTADLCFCVFACMERGKTSIVIIVQD